MARLSCRRVGLVLASSTVFMLPTAVGAEGHSESGPCRGASAPLQSVLAHVVGRQARQSIKVVAHLESDVEGVVSGELKVGQGTQELVVTEWCRLWAGGSGAGAGGEDEAGVVHVLGAAMDTSGNEKLVRVDVNPEEGGRVRVRTRLLAHDGSRTEPADEHGGWVSLTGEGWLNATRVRIRPISES